FLLREPHAIPRLDPHCDAACDEEGSAVVGPDVRRERRLVVGEDVRRAVLEAEEIARRLLPSGGSRGPTEAQLRPAQHGAAEGDAGEVADRVDRDLRIVGTGLNAQITVALLRIEILAEERGQSFEPLGQAAPKPEALVEDTRPEAEGDGERAR